MQPQKRDFNPYELNQLYKHGLNPDHFSAQIQDPVEYLTGHVTFRGQDFFVSPEVLIPRPETEELVDLVLDHIAALPETGALKIADIGTGSGVIGLSLALELSPTLDAFDILLGDISAAALKVAQKNAQQLLSDDWLSQKISFVESDLLTRFPTGPFDLIIANLPYIPSARLATLEPSVTAYEPLLALDGGDDGLDEISRLITQAEDYLSDTGHVFLEIDHTHTAAMLQSLSQTFKVEVLKDSLGRTRFAHFYRIQNPS